jgi:hypothetical protein
MTEQEPAYFRELKILITDYLGARIRLLKFEVFEKTAIIAATLFSSFVIAMLAFFLLFFLSIALGFYFGAVFESYGTGFLMVTGLYLIILIPFIVFRKSLIEKLIINRIIGQLTEKEEEEL